MIDISCIPGVDGSQKCVYLAGNSLGLQPVGVKQLVSEELEKWKNKLANGIVVLYMCMYSILVQFPSISICLLTTASMHLSINYVCWR